jgi:hypothetical protein
VRCRREHHLDQVQSHVVDGARWRDEESVKGQVARVGNRAPLRLQVTGRRLCVKRAYV